MLCVEELQGSHTGSHICEKFNVMLTDWKTDKPKVHVVLRDNASNLDKAMVALPIHYNLLLMMEC